MKRTGGSCLVLTLVWLQSVAAQPGHWDNDRVLSGFEGDERFPAITFTSGELHACCELNGDSAIHTVSLNGGLTWTPQSQNQIAHFGGISSYQASTDGRRSLFLIGDASPAQLELNSILPVSEGGTLQGLSVLISSSDSTLESFAICSDHNYHPDEPFVSIAFLRRLGSGGRIAVAETRDSGESLAAFYEVATVDMQSPRSKRVSLAYTSEGDSETLWLAHSRERDPASNEQVELIPIENEQPGAPVYFDFSAYPQLQVSIAAHERTILVAYTRRVNAAAQKEVFFCYSPDGGSTFSQVEPITSTTTDENHPKVVIQPEYNRFAVFYLAGEHQQSDATLWVREGVLSTPWLPAAATQVSDSAGVSLAGGYDATATASGFAAAWSGQGLAGDLDIWFDSADLATGTHSWQELFPQEFEMGSAYPNPFNAATTIPLRLVKPGSYEFSLVDILGREIAAYSSTINSPGQTELSIDLSEHSSGVYYLSDLRRRQIQKLILLK